MKVYGYCRISTSKQSMERQIRNIKLAYPDAVIVKETYTGTKIQGRKEFEKLLKIVSTGDTLVFDSVSRMSRGRVWKGGKDTNSFSRKADEI